MSAMKPVITALALLLAVPTLTSCDRADDVYDPLHCDYEQAQTTQAEVAPVDRAEWADYNGDGVVVLCMWTGMVE